jgi:hypothetical protein
MTYTDGLTNLLAAVAVWLFLIVFAAAALILIGEWFDDWISE